MASKGFPQIRARYRVLAALAVALPLASSPAALIYDNNSNSNSYNITDPGTTNTTSLQSLWNNVVQIRKNDGTTPDASGVYLGNKFVLTASHVQGTRYFIMGTEYLVDPTFSITQITTGTDNRPIDLKVIKLLAAPDLPGVQMAGSGDTTTGVSSLFIGWGVGKGAPDPASPSAQQGWLWGNDSTAMERWGSSTTGGSIFTSDPDYPASSYITTTFDRSTDNAFALATGDSGGGLFQFIGGQWKLAGVAEGVDVGGRSYYDNDPNIAGDQSPDTGYFVSMQVHSADVLAVIPEPSTWALALLGFSAALALKARQPRPRMAYALGQGNRGQFGDRRRRIA